MRWVAESHAGNAVLCDKTAAVVGISPGCFSPDEANPLITRYSLTDNRALLKGKKN